MGPQDMFTIADTDFFHARIPQGRRWFPPQHPDTFQEPCGPDPCTILFGTRGRRPLVDTYGRPVLLAGHRRPLTTTEPTVGASAQCTPVSYASTRDSCVETLRPAAAAQTAPHPALGGRLRAETLGAPQELGAGSTARRARIGQRSAPGRDGKEAVPLLLEQPAVAS